MQKPTVKPKASPALRMAGRAWRLLHLDAVESRALADRALARAMQDSDLPGEAWARLVRGFHQLYFAAPGEAADELSLSLAVFEACQDRPGQLLATAGQARALWRSGRATEAMALLLPLRDEGLRLLRHEQRGVLLNAIAGCFSAQGRSDEAFAYMFEALRHAGPARGHGFDAALHCNLSHELMELGDHDQALEQIERGLARCEGMRNTRLESVLRINRVVVLTELGRAAEAMPDVQRLCDITASTTGRGTRALHFETLAIAALRAGETSLGAELLQQAQLLAPTMLPDERVELAVAQALHLHQQGQGPAALAALQAVQPWVAGATGADGAAGVRASAVAEQLASELHEALGDTVAALAALRRWQALMARRASLASSARYQAAALQTELIKLHHRLEETDVKRRATERARAEMALANLALSRKIEEVQALQAALREQATQDVLTGLFNRRHLNDTLPSMLALTLREKQPLAVVVVDLDHFKAVNDEHGHHGGDLLLAAFGRLLREQLRSSDQSYRYGGEEFCLLMPNTTAAAARDKVEQLLQRWQQAVFDLDTGHLQGMSFSAGVADTLQTTAT
ncbi:MAG: GGDEF domain-containing protein, partial [Rubrivivax sp.]|nr:GGDEF domain-containing protein [Rubrivivax sp.]